MIRLGFDVYSLRAYRWKAMQLIDYAAQLHLDAIQFSSPTDYESVDPGHLARVRKHAASRGITIDAGIGCICPTSKSYQPHNGDPVGYIREGLRIAHDVGAKTMRCFVGAREDRFANGPIEKHMDAAIEILRGARSTALDLGITIALENHSGDLQAREVKTIIEEAGLNFVGSCLDTGNAILAVEDPMVTLETLGPYVVTTHIRDLVVYEHERGCAFQWVALGDGMLKWDKFLERFAQLCPHAPVHLEIITGRPVQVVPYLDPEFWKAFPHASAAEFARFVALVKSGRPFDKFMVIEDGASSPPPEYVSALKLQQRYDLERSIEFAKKKLGVGIRWRDGVAPRD